VPEVNTWVKTMVDSLDRAHQEGMMYSQSRFVAIVISILSNDKGCTNGNAVVAIVQPLFFPI
jgi:hypothetical protein